MRPICLTHKISESRIFQFNVKLGQDGDVSSYVRNCIAVHASPNVTWQDIVNEANSKTKNQPLETVTVLIDYRIVSLSVGAFMAQAVSFYHFEDPDDAPFEKRQESLAKELIATRDYEANGGYKNKDHKQWDYWPKD